MTDRSNTRHKFFSLGFPIWLSPLLLALLLLLPALTKASETDACDPGPSTLLKPGEVIKTVIDALRDNDATDAGIATVFCFASPGNKAQTGPLERFTNMIKRGFSDMLNHSDSYYDDIQIRGDVAVQPVWLVTSDGKEVGYLFRMGKQASGEFQGMWMTDGVMPLDPSSRQQSI